MNWTCTKIYQIPTIVRNKPYTKNVVCGKPLKTIGFWKDYFGVFRLACEEHWST